MTPSELRSALAALPPIEQDATLARIWSSFRNTEAHAALVLLLDNCSNRTQQQLFSPALTGDSRAFQAGRLAALVEVINTVTAAMSFDPSRAEYEPLTVVDSSDPNSQKEDYIY